MIRLAFFLLLLCVSCGPKSWYEHSFPMDGSGWHVQDTKLFSFEAPDTLSSYDLTLELKHADDYAYQNVYLKTATIFPNKDTINDIISIDLTDTDGFWLGKGSSIKALHAPLQVGFKFREAGTYSITIDQHSREDKLEGIESVGLHLTDSVSE